MAEQGFEVLNFATFSRRGQTGSPVLNFVVFLFFSDLDLECGARKEDKPHGRFRN